MTLRWKQRKNIVRLDNAIVAAAKRRGIDPYTESFTPKDLMIKAGPYGSFSDWCSHLETNSGK